MITSRGCPGKCVFCSIHAIWGKKYRPRSVDNIIREIKQIVNAYQIEELHFEDDNLTFDKERARDLFTAIKQEIPDLRWGAPNGIALWTLDETLIKLMAESGCRFVTLAIESGNQRVLKEVIKKPVKLERIKHIISMMKKNRIRADGMFVIGLPGETIAEIEETIDFALKLDLPDISFFIATPYPATELYDNCKEKGLLSDDYTLAGLQVHKRAFINTDEFSAEDIIRLRKEAIDRFLISRLKQGPVNWSKYYLKKILRAIGVMK